MDHSKNPLPRQLVAITLADGSVAVMQFFTHFYRHAEDEEGVAREATDEAIQAEIDKSAFSQPVASWRRIADEDLPTTRANRDAWRDDGKRIAVDQAEIKAAPKDRTAELEERLAALEATVEAPAFTGART